MNVDLLSLTIGAGIGAVITALGFKLYARKQARDDSGDAERARLEERLQQATRLLEDSEINLSEIRKEHEQRGLHLAQLEPLKERYADLEQRFEHLRNDHGEQGRELARLAQEHADADVRHGEQLALLKGAREEMEAHFKALAGDVLKSQSEQSAKQQQERLGYLLTPLRERLEGFQKQVKEAYETEGKERSGMLTEIRRLAQLNEKLHAEADALTQALTGNTKARGDWGEVILERLLEFSGLRKDSEYRLQVSAENDEGQRFQPDVVVDLPGARHLVVDSKLNLIPWMKLVQAETPEQELAATRALASGLRAHINDLHVKRYQDLYGLESIDFVCCFIPIEAAFTAAVGSDPGLYREALERNVVLVSPATLLATLRTIAHTWTSERQERNALKIAQEAGRMHSQFVNFVDALEDIGKRLEQAQSSFTTAHKRLVSGRGNLVGRAEKLDQLGARTAKKLRLDYDHQEGEDES